MKKLTAGIFTVLMGLVTVNAAEAAVASKGYVDEVAKAAAANVTALEATVTANKSAADTAIAAAQKAGDDAAAALASYQTSNDAAVEKNAEDIAKNATAIATNATSISNNATAIATEKSDREAADIALDGRLDTAEVNITTLQGDVAALSGQGEGSVAAQIAGALTEAKDYTDDLAEGAVATNTAAIAAINNADTGILKQAQTYADTAEADAIAAAAEAAKIYIDADELKASQDAQDAAIKTAYEAADKVITDSIGEVAEGQTVVEMIEAAQTAATYDDTALKARVSANETGIANNATEIAKKLTDTTAISADGKYVLTAVTVGEDTTYAWELIERATDTTQE